MFCVQVQSYASFDFWLWICKSVAKQSIICFRTTEQQLIIAGGHLERKNRLAFSVANLIYSYDTISGEHKLCHEAKFTMNFGKACLGPNSPNQHWSMSLPAPSFVLSWWRWQHNRSQLLSWAHFHIAQPWHSDGSALGRHLNASPVHFCISLLWGRVASNQVKAEVSLV